MLYVESLRHVPHGLYSNVIPFDKVENKVNNKILNPIRRREKRIYYWIQKTRKTDGLLLSDKSSDLDTAHGHKAKYNGGIIHQ